ncbi:MAG: ATP-binding protein, partial [Glaciihabitans sp.]
LRRAARQEELAMARARAELNASALLHDTVLRDLSQLRSSGTGPLGEQLSEQLRFDLDLLASGIWAPARTPRGDSGTAAVSPDFQSVLASVEELGLTVEVCGDHAAVGDLTADRRLALALAMHQCLVNVSEHAGVTRAEVTLARTDAMVSVMVVDSGRGFRVEDTAPDRLGLRQSVLRRMTDVGGDARVWSVPGEGTAVQLLLPVGTAS